jgi:hypothetical protein
VTVEASTVTNTVVVVGAQVSAESKLVNVNSDQIE